jgi:hypothetical protein
LNRREGERGNHKVQSTEYTEYHSVCPLVGMGTPPTPLSQASVPPPPPDPNGGAHSSAEGGVGETQYRPGEKA